MTNSFAPSSTIAIQIRLLLRSVARPTSASHCRSVRLGEAATGRARPEKGTLETRQVGWSRGGRGETQESPSASSSRQLSAAGPVIPLLVHSAGRSTGWGEATRSGSRRGERNNRWSQERVPSVMVYLLQALGVPVAMAHRAHALSLVLLSGLGLSTQPSKPFHNIARRTAAGASRPELIRIVLGQYRSVARCNCCGGSVCRPPTGSSFR